MDNTLSTVGIVKKYGFRFSKSLGQNFLIDNSVLQDIVDGAQITGEDTVIEIGPGVGTLTKELLKKAKMVYSIEIDSKLIPILKEELKDYDNFELINNDVLKVNFDEIIKDEKPVKVVANLPYYVTTPVLTQLLKNHCNFKSITVMIQKEVAQRIAANPGNKEYGSLSVLIQYYCDIKIIRKVSANCFIPKPKVDSAVIRLDKLDKTRVEPKDEKLFFNIVRASFNMRRKTLNNSLKPLGFNEEIMKNAFEASSIDPSRRGETLSLDEFKILCDNIYEIKTSLKNNQ